MDAPTALPEGTVLTLVCDDEGDDLDEAERSVLHDRIERAWRSAQAGLGCDARDLIAGFRAMIKPVSVGLKPVTTVGKGV